MRNKLNVFMVLTFFLSISYVSAQKKAFSIEDLYKIQSAGNIVKSPDGTKVAFTVTKSILSEGKSITNVWIMDSNGQNQTQITNGAKSSSSPFWSKDGQKLYYVASVKGVEQVYEYSFANKTSTQITNFYMGVNSPVLSPDNHLIAFCSEVYPDCGADSSCNALTDSLAKHGPTQAYMADELLFRHWTDYSEGKCSHVFIYNIEKQTYTDLTPGKFVSPTFMLGGGVGYNFSPDSKELCFVSNHDTHPEASTNADLFIVPVVGGNAVNITSGNKAWDGWPIYSPDGKYIAYRNQQIPGYESDLFRLSLYDRTSGKITVLTDKFDNWVTDFKWSENSQAIYFLGEVEGHQPLYKIDVAKHNVEPVVISKAISDFEVNANGDVYYIASAIGKPNAIYKQYSTKVKRKLKERTEQLTNFNADLENTVDIRPADTMWVAGADGKKVEVFLVKPHDFDPNKKYPLIINVHGGPQSQWMNSFRGDWQVYPGAGYVLAFANPHGSTGYGQEYTRSISEDWGGKPFVDLMKVTDKLAQLSYVDSTRMGAMGWSYGGYMMNWFQAQTKRFKCLASMMGLYDLRSMWGTTEELWFPNFDLNGQPWNSDLYKKFSPSEYVKNFATPTLIITGQLDFRVSYTQSLQYFSTLQTLGIPSRLIILKNDGHWPSNVKSMPLYYNAHLDWFHKYLGGYPAPYDMDKMIKNQIFTTK